MAVYRKGVGVGLEPWQSQKIMEAMSGVHDTMAETDCRPNRTFDDSVDAILSQLRSIMLRKQADYGPRNILDCGEVGVVIRANDKLARIRNLYGISDGTFQKKTASNESIEDSFVDLANYAIIALMLRAHAFDLPLKSDLTKRSPAKPTCSGCDSVSNPECSGNCVQKPWPSTVI